MSEYPEDVMKAAEKALDNMLCHCVEASGSSEAYRLDSVKEIARAIMADRERWQDISTAPKDGTEFLAYDVRTKKMDVCIMVLRGAYGWRATPVQSDSEYGPDSSEFGFNEIDIEYWMPLPTPPSSGASS